MRIAALVAASLACVAVGVGAQTQKDDSTIRPGERRHEELGRTDLSVGRQAITAVDHLGPTSATGWHTHPGEVVGYITEGTVVIEQRGKATLTLQPGQSFVIPAGVAHNSRNNDGTSARMFVTFIVEKDKPLSTAAAVR